jgi:hypothetical protein
METLGRAETEAGAGVEIAPRMLSPLSAHCHFRTGLRYYHRGMKEREKRHRFPQAALD